MALEDLQLSRLSGLTAALDRIPQGRAAIELARRLGLFTPAHEVTEDRRVFPSRLSDLSNDELSDLHAYWLSEAGRITEIVGQLTGQKQLVSLEIDQALASVRSRIRRDLPEGAKAPPQHELNDQAADDLRVTDLWERQAFIDLLLAHAKAAQSATGTYLSGIDKEVVLRTSQMKARILQ